ncbi:GABA transporter, putative, partial [Ixodes scapularis]
MRVCCFSSQVWVDAATQVFFSLGPGFGVLLAFSSYNEFHNNVYRCKTVCLILLLVELSLAAPKAVVKHQPCLPAQEMVYLRLGPGLVFIVYPEAIAAMPGSTFWAIIFFLMLLTLGLDSSVRSPPHLLTWQKRKKKGGICVFHLTNLLPVMNLYCFQGGVYVVNMLDRYAASYSILIAVFFEAVAVSWIYGIRRFSEDIQEMLGFPVGCWWKFCWAVVAPFFILIIIASGLVNYERLSYNEYVYPWGADAVGICVAASSVLCIPAFALWNLVRTP